MRQPARGLLLLAAVAATQPIPPASHVVITPNTASPGTLTSPGQQPILTVPAIPALPALPPPALSGAAAIGVPPLAGVAPPSGVAPPTTGPQTAAEPAPGYPATAPATIPPDY